MTAEDAELVGSQTAAGRQPEVGPVIEASKVPHEHFAFELRVVLIGHSAVVRQTAAEDAPEHAFADGLVLAGHIA